MKAVVVPNYYIPKKRKTKTKMAKNIKDIMKMTMKMILMMIQTELFQKEMKKVMIMMMMLMMIIILIMKKKKTNKQETKKRKESLTIYISKT